MSEGPDQTRPPRFVIARIAVLIIAIVWVISGTLKVLRVDAFIDTLQQHRVIPDQYRGLGLYVGPAEIVLGLVLVFVMGSELRKLFGRAVLLVSLLAIISFSVYLSMVDPVTLQESGCGCLGDYRIASGIENGEYVISMIRNGLLVVLHLVAIAGPIVTRRKCAAQQRDSASA
ncbi:MAG: hypothetical protein KC996_07650 [Phycisphaerales bacterium]|nr:hypothetical protein [Phycisphaerales bacterium]